MYNNPALKEKKDFSYMYIYTHAPFSSFGTFCIFLTISANVTAPFLHCEINKIN